MSELATILCVDDEANVLDGLKRVLFEHFDVHTATSGAAALEKLETREYAVILSDMRMPHMDGAEFLSRARAMVPDTTRMLLTGHAELDAAVSAINDGNIYRFLVKPCPEEQLVRNLADGVALHRLVKSEKELLENTLRGSIDVLTQIINLTAPTAYYRSSFVFRYVSHMAAELAPEHRWQLEIAAMLAQIGSVVVPPDVTEKAFTGMVLSDEEKEMMKSIGAEGGKLIAGIPRLDGVAAMIANQRTRADQLLGEPPVVQLGARMLRVAHTLDQIIVQKQCDFLTGLLELKLRTTDRDDRPLLDCLRSLKDVMEDAESVPIPLKELQEGMQLYSDIVAKNGNVVLSRGHRINATMIARLRNFASRIGIVEPIRIFPSDKLATDQQAA